MKKILLGTVWGKWSKLLYAFFILIMAGIFFQLPEVKKIEAYTCFDFPISRPLTDLGTDEYYRLTGSPGASPSTWTYTRQPGIIGGLYANGSNVRPPAHDAAGVALAQEIEPLDANGDPSVNGKIGMVSLGMSNTYTEFARFKTIAAADPALNDKLVIVNGAVSGGTTERWAYPADSQYQSYWDQFDARIAQAGITHDQIQVAWVKITYISNRYYFPSNTELYETELEAIARELKNRLPNLKITYFSSRTRSHIYWGGPADPSAFENGIGVRWLIEKQINGDMSLNYKPELGPTPVSYMAWGPYLWIDGANPRSDGRTWPISNVVQGDCIHPSPSGSQAVAEMLLAFFKSDTTATPWFLDIPPLPPQPDTIMPNVSISAPVSGNSVNGTVTVTASATDNVGVAGVQFLMDGVNLGTEDTVAPYSTSWNTIGTSNGSHVLTARARDAAGNYGISSPVSVVVANDVTAPSIPNNLSASAISSSQVNLSWATSTDNIGVDHYIVYRCQGAACTPTTQIGTSITTAFQDVGLTALTNYNYAVSATDAIGNISDQSAPAAVTTIGDIASPVISNVSTTNLTDTSVTINWITDEPADTQVEFTSACPATGCFTPLVFTFSTNHSVNVSGLLPNTTYLYSVRSRDTSGNLTTSPSQSFITPNTPAIGAPISSWGFGSDTVTDDINGCTGCSKVGSATWFTPSIKSGGYNFSGTASLNLGSFPYLNNKANFSITIWVKPNFDQTSTVWNYAFNDGINVSIYYLGANRYWRGMVRTTTMTYYVNAPASLSWTPGTWHQVGLTYNGSAIKLYWDGVLVSTKSATGPVAGDFGSTYIGTTMGGGTFSGAIDELKVYDVALTDAQMNTNFLNP